MKIKELAKYFPIPATLLIDAAGVGQIIRMFTERTAEGQSLTSWLMVTVALLFWHEFYRLRTPDEKLALWTARVGIALNIFISGAVVYWRYFA